MPTQWDASLTHAYNCPPFYAGRRKPKVAFATYAPTLGTRILNLNELRYKTCLLRRLNIVRHDWANLPNVSKNIYGGKRSSSVHESCFSTAILLDFLYCCIWRDVTSRIPNIFPLSSWQSVKECSRSISIQNGGSDMTDIRLRPPCFLVG